MIIYRYKGSRWTEVGNNNNMNSTLFNSVTQTSHIPHTLIQPVIPGITVWIEIPEEQTIRHYDELIIAIIKVINI